MFRVSSLYCITKSAGSDCILESIEQPWLLPRGPNPQYVGYTHVLAQLESCVLQASRTQVVCVLSGMGGVGKSETILQFVGKNDEALRERCSRYSGSDVVEEALIDS